LLSKPFLDFVHPDDRAATTLEVEKLSAGDDCIYFENRYRCKDGSYCWLAWTCKAPAPGETVLYAVARDITNKKVAEAERERIIGELHSALSQVKLLSGLLPICASCKKIRDDTGQWKAVEVYVRDH